MVLAADGGAYLERIASMLASIDVSSLDDGVLARVIVDAERLLNVVHVLSAIALGEVERRGAWATEDRCLRLIGPPITPVPRSGSCERGSRPGRG
jgi:hypothetical protein